MYKTKNLQPTDLEKVVITNQEEIEQEIGSKLDLKEAFEIIKKRSNGFTTADVEAQRADALLYALVSGKPKGVDIREGRYRMSDGTVWELLSKEEALQRFRQNKEVFAINTEEETERVITSEKDTELWDVFGVPAPLQERKKEIKNKTASNPLSKEQIRIRQKQQASELALLALELELEEEKPKSA